MSLKCLARVWSVEELSRKGDQCLIERANFMCGFSAIEVSTGGVDVSVSVKVVIDSPDSALSSSSRALWTSPRSSE